MTATAHVHDEPVHPDRVDEQWMEDDHDYVIYRSTVPVDVDGYKIDEPMTLCCPHCRASVVLTAEPSAGIDQLEHDRDCPNLE